MHRFCTNARVPAVAIVFCAGAYAYTYTFDAVPDVFMQGLGPALFPRLVLIVMGLLAILLALGAEDPDAERPAPVDRKVWLVGAAMAVYMGGLELVGMWPASVILLVALGLIWGERRTLVLLSSAILFCATLYLLFVKALGSTFPAGLLGDFLR
jgi:hypothetical protein